VRAVRLRLDLVAARGMNGRDPHLLGGLLLHDHARLAPARADAEGPLAEHLELGDAGDALGGLRDVGGPFEKALDCRFR